MPQTSFIQVASIIACTLAVPFVGRAAKAEPDDPSKPVSYFKRVRPIFQAECQGCHQPAKAKGGYVMTDFAKLLRGGESADKGDLSIVPGDPDKSFLIQEITPVDGEAETTDVRIQARVMNVVPFVPIYVHATSHGPTERLRPGTGP